MAITPLNLTPKATELQPKSNDRPMVDQQSQAKPEQAASSQASAVGRQDTVKLSGTAQSIQGAERKLANTPDVDQNKVDRLKAAIESGEYKVDSQRTAEGMLNIERLFA